MVFLGYVKEGCSAHAHIVNTYSFTHELIVTRRGLDTVETRKTSYLLPLGMRKVIMRVSARVRGLGYSQSHPGAA